MDDGYVSWRRKCNDKVMEKLVFNKCSNRVAGCIERQLCIYTKVRNERKFLKCIFIVAISKWLSLSERPTYLEKQFLLPFKFIYCYFHNCLP